MRLHKANQASALYATGQFEEAIRKAEQALELRADLPDALYTVGASYWQTNERDRARQYFQRFLEMDPRNPNADAVRRILGRP